MAIASYKLRLRVITYYRDIQVEIKRYKFVLLFINFDREYWGFSLSRNQKENCKPFNTESPESRK